MRLFLAVMENLLESVGVNFLHGRPYHPQTQGSVERFNKTVKLWVSASSHVSTFTHPYHSMGPDYLNIFVTFSICVCEFVDTAWATGEP